MFDKHKELKHLALEVISYLSLLASMAGFNSGKVDAGIYFMLVAIFFMLNSFFLLHIKIMTVNESENGKEG